MKTIETPIHLSVNPNESGSPLVGGHEGDDGTPDKDKDIAAIRDQAEAMGLSPEVAEEAVADYQKAQGHELENDGEASPDDLLQGLNETKEKLAEMDEILKNMGELNAEISKALEKVIKIILIIIEYIHKINEAKDPEEKKALEAELQEEIDKVR